MNRGSPCRGPEVSALKQIEANTQRWQQQMATLQERNQALAQ